MYFTRTFLFLNYYCSTFFPYTVENAMKACKTDDASGRGEKTKIPRDFRVKKILYVV